MSTNFWAEHLAREEARKAEQMTREEVMAKIKEMGGVQAIVDFHGGGDEGHIESVYIYSKQVRTKEGLADQELDILKNSHVATIQEHYTGNRFDQESQQWIKIEITPEQVQETRLFEAITEPVNEEFGSFAGEFSVDGVVVWDVELDSVWMDGTVYTEVGEGLYKEFG